MNPTERGRPTNGNGGNAAPASRRFGENPVLETVAADAALSRDGKPRPGPALNGRLFSSYDLVQAENDREWAMPRASAGPAFDDEPLIVHPAPSQGVATTGLELVLDSNDLLPFAFLRNGDRLGRAVVKLLRRDGAAATGFLVAPDVLLTNHHVLPDAETAAGTQAYANYESVPPADPAGRAVVVDLKPNLFFVTEPDLDFAFCGVEGLDHLGKITPDRNSLNVIPSEPVNIIQHPGGRPKEVALQDNQVIRVDNVTVQYSCDTEPGSSGSPVFNNNWDIIALHHASVVVDQSLGGRCQCGTDPTTHYLNEGVRLSAIALWLETAAAEERLGRDRAARLRSLFRGIDSQIGFFGALGRPITATRAQEAVVECYHARHRTLDLGFWDLARATRPFEPIDAMVRFLVSMGMDAWCLPGCTPDLLHLIEEHIARTYHLDCEGISAVNHAGEPIGLLIRGHSPIKAEWLGREHQIEQLRLQLALDDQLSVAVQLVLVIRGRGPRRRRVEDLLRRHASGHILVMMGDGLNARDIQTLSAAHPELRAAFGPDGGVAILPRNDFELGSVYVAPNVELTIGSARELVVASDRSWPQEAESIGGSRPLAVRLAFPALTPARNLAANPDREPPGTLLPDMVDALEGVHPSDVERVLMQLLAQLKGRRGNSLAVRPADREPATAARALAVTRPGGTRGALR